MGDKPSWFTALASRVLLLLGVAYVSLWWSYQQFYSVFGVAPDDVGLTPSGGISDIVGGVLRLGLWLSMALIALALLPVGVVAAAMYAIERKRDEGSALPNLPGLVGGRNDPPESGEASDTQTPREGAFLRRIRIEVWGGPVLAVLLLGVVGAFYYWLVGWIYCLVVVGLIVVVALTWMGLSSKIPADKASTSYTIRWFNARQWWLLRAVDAFLVVAVVGVLFIDLPGDARDVAGKLLARVNTARACKVSAIGAPVNFFELDLLGVHALPAKFAVDKLPKGLPQNHPFRGIYLGTANGWLVIYRKIAKAGKTTGQVLRIPTSSGVAMRVNASIKGCPGVHGPNEQAK